MRMKWLHLLACFLVLNSHGLCQEELLYLDAEPDLRNGTDSGGGGGGGGSNPKYSLEQVTDNAGSMGPLYKMSRQFAHAVGPEKPIFDEVLEYMNGTRKLQDAKDVLEILKMESGFLACLALGLIMFFGLGIAGTCFCCCRCCCGNCGGKKTLSPGEDSNTSRKVYSFLLFVTVVLMLVALGCGYTVSRSFGKAILKSEDTTVDILDDAATFFDNTAQELENLAIVGVENVTQDLVYNLNDLAKSIGTPLQEIEELDNIRSSIATVDRQLATLNQAEKDIRKDVTEPSKNIHSKLAEIKKELKKIKEGCNPDCDDLDVVGVELPDVDAGKIQKLPVNIQKTLDEETMKIPQKVQQTTGNAVKDAKNAIDKFLKDFKVGEFRKNINESSQVTKYFPETKADLKKTYKSVREHESNLYYGMVGVISLVTVPVLLLCLGMCCGCAGHRASRHPAERSGLSNCGGCTIITGVYLLFFLTGIPILVMTFSFQIGGHTQTILCDVVYQEDFHTFDRVFDFLKSKMELKANILKELAPSKTFKKCENSSTVYEALDLESVFKLDTELDISKKLNLKEKLEDIKVVINFDLDSVNKMTDDIDKFDKTTFVELLRQLKIRFDEEKYNEWIENLKGFNPPGDLENRLQEQIGRIKILHDQDITPVNYAKDRIAGELTTVDVDNLKKNAKDLKETLNKIPTVISKKAQKMRDDFVLGLQGTVLNFTSGAMYKIKHEIGQCKPVWVIFDVSRHLFCRDILDPLNAYWFCLGWALFFSIFAIAFGTKLSRHYVRMTDMKRGKWEEDLEPREYIMGSTEDRPCIPMREGGMNYQNQGYHSPPVYAGPPPTYGYGPQIPPNDARMRGYNKY